MRSQILAILSLLTPICFMTLHVLRLIQVAPASASQSQNHALKEATGSCPITKPPAQAFVPPPPYWTDPGPHSFWYGTESLWTLLAVEGTWNIHGNVLESKGGYGTKLTYWRRGFDWRSEPEPELVVIAKRLDRTAPTVAAGPAHAVFVTTERPGIMTAIDIPSAGCWEIAAQYRGHRLSYVVSVQP